MHAPMLDSKYYLEGQMEDPLSSLGSIVYVLASKSNTIPYLGGDTNRPLRIFFWMA